MTRKEAIEIFKRLKENAPNEMHLETVGSAQELFSMAISALEEDISEDGTLTVKVADGSKVSRVFVCGDNIWGGLYYLEDDINPNKTDIEGIRAEIDKAIEKEHKWLMHTRRTLCDIDIAFNGIKSAISKIIKGVRAV